MNFEDWLKMYNKEYNTDYTSLDCNWFMLDMYADFRLKELQSKIFQFRTLLKEKSLHDCISNGVIINSESTKEWLSVFDEHFNIESITKGQI